MNDLTPPDHARTAPDDKARPQPMARSARPLVLALLLAGMVLTVVMTPSALLAQQGPPGTLPPSGYGAAPSTGPAGPRLLALAGNSLGGGIGDIWLVLGIIVGIVVLGGAALYLRSRA